MTEFEKNMDDIFCHIKEDLYNLKINMTEMEKIINNKINKGVNCVSDLNGLELLEDKINTMMYNYQIMKEKIIIEKLNDKFKKNKKDKKDEKKDVIIERKNIINILECFGIIDNTE
jgi:hypothetical protein